MFRTQIYKLVVTEHARHRMASRVVTIEMIVDILKSGNVMDKTEENKFWVFKSMSGRNDNFICLSIAIEDPNLVVITALVNWRPHQ